MRSLILLPCSGSKKPGGLPDYERNHTVLQTLPKDQGNQLIKLRRELFEYFNDVSMGNEIYRTDQSVPNLGRLAYMAAYERYSAQRSLVYASISPQTWNLLGKSENVIVLIISAFYGVLRYDEPIQDYNRVMDKDRIRGTKLQTWWHNNGLPEIIRSFIATNNIGQVYSFLSLPYSDAIDIYRIGRNVEDFPELKCGIGTPRRRGERFASLVQELLGNRSPHESIDSKDRLVSDYRPTTTSAPSKKDTAVFDERRVNDAGIRVSQNIRHEEKKTNRYSSLAEHLEGRSEGSIRLCFDEIEKIIGGPLPSSARKYNAWWANNLSHTQGKAWLDSGWRAQGLDLRGETISFFRVSRK